MVPAPPWMTIPKFSSVFGVLSEDFAFSAAFFPSFLHPNRKK
jgi:hypothetical protein